VRKSEKNGPCDSKNPRFFKFGTQFGTLKGAKTAL